MNDLIVGGKPDSVQGLLEKTGETIQIGSHKVKLCGQKPFFKIFFEILRDILAGRKRFYLLAVYNIRSAGKDFL